MKKSKTIQFILMILICIVIILIGFFGIYVKRANTYQNLLPDYTLATDLKGATSLEFEVDDSTETIYYDKDGKKVDTSTVTDENKKDYKAEEKAKNAPEVLTTENYQQVVEIMKKRLQFLKTDQYRLDLDEKTGKIVLTFEYAYADDIKSILPMEGRLELVDSNTNDVVLDFSDFESAEATYASLEEGYTTYLHLKLNDSGLNKINNLDYYKQLTNTEQNEENAEEITAVTNQVKIMFDDEQIVEVSYDDLLLTNKTLRITTSENLTSNTSIQSQMNTNTVVAKLATMGKMPVVYQLTAEEYVKSNIDNLPLILSGILVICLVIAIDWIVRFKLNGILAVLTFATNIALFLILMRLTNVPISLNSFAGSSINIS